MSGWFKRAAQAFYRTLLALTTVAVFTTAMSSSAVPAIAETRQQVRTYTRSIEFDYVGWTIEAIWSKFLEFSLNASSFLPAVERRELVLDYLASTAEIQQLEWQIRTVFADPDIPDPHEVSEPLRRQLEARQAQQRKIAPIAEAVLQGQINTVVSELDLAIAGQAFPPVLYHSTPLPMALIVSPRHTIRQDADISLAPDLPLEQQVALEAQVDSSLDVSSLVVNIGGVGVYPTMVMQTGDINWLSEVVAHEWVHNYLTLRPLGFNYMKDPALRIINETTASIAGKEIGLAVLQRYYPELVPPPPPAPPPVPDSGDPPAEPPAEPQSFDFRKEMHLTRITVDELLAGGKVEQAEAYMETRRELFWGQGYHGLRKINQAYFAFYGAYADEDQGAAGEDPVGAAVRRLRADSPTLADFLRRIAVVTDFAQLEQMLAAPN